VTTAELRRRSIGPVGSLAELPTAEVIERVLGSDSRGLADVAEELRAANDAAWVATAPRLLELCRVRIAVLLGCAAEADARTPGSGVADDVLAAIRAWPTDPRFGPLDQACLGFAEHYVIDVASIDDGTVAAVREHLGDEGLVNFVNALLVVEQRIRLRLVWDRLFGGI
jgi:alkylhydroperoxidase family enzyme